VKWRVQPCVGISWQLGKLEPWDFLNWNWLFIWKGGPGVRTYHMISPCVKLEAYMEPTFILESRLLLGGTNDKNQCSTVPSCANGVGVWGAGDWWNVCLETIFFRSQRTTWLFQHVDSILMISHHHHRIIRDFSGNLGRCHVYILGLQLVNTSHKLWQGLW
jgi:hypothetical protein